MFPSLCHNVQSHEVTTTLSTTIPNSSPVNTCVSAASQRFANQLQPISPFSLLQLRVRPQSVFLNLLFMRLRIFALFTLPYCLDFIQFISHVPFSLWGHTFFVSHCFCCIFFSYPNSVSYIVSVPQATSFVLAASQDLFFR